MDPADSNRCPSCFVPLEFGAACTDQYCEADAADRSLNDLPLGTVLDNQFRIGRVLGRGGFGITYLSWDERLQRRAAVKECFPQGLVRRSRDGATILASSEGTKRQFEIVRELFLREARVLAHFPDQPGIVSVLSVLEAHSSAYLVMEYLSGQTLKEYLESHPDNRIDYWQTLALLRPIMVALTAVHEQNWLHRDVSPDNIFVTRRGVVKLLDFGAARYAAGQQTRSLPIILKEGYAPMEQYATKGQQGTWTDVYALAATFYRAITGTTPPPALDRLEMDEYVPPSQMGVDIPPHAEAALAAALAVKWQGRTRTIAEFSAQLESESDEQSPSHSDADPDRDPEMRPMSVWPDGSRGFDDLDPIQPLPSRPTPPLGKWLAGAVGLLLVGFPATYYLMRPDPVSVVIAPPNQPANSGQGDGPPPPPPPSGGTAVSTDKRLRAVRTAVSSRRLAEAVRLLERGVAESPQDGALAAELKNLRAERQRQIETHDRLLRQGDAARVERRYPEAIDFFQQALKEDPESQLAPARFKATIDQKAQVDKTINDILGGQDRATVLKRANVLLSAQLYSEAIAMFDEILKTAPADPEALEGRTRAIAARQGTPRQ